MKEAAQFWDSYLWTSEYQKINDESSPYNGQDRLVVAPSFLRNKDQRRLVRLMISHLSGNYIKNVFRQVKLLGKMKHY